MPPGDRSLWGDAENYLGHDDFATYKTNTHADIRDGVVRYWVEKGWQPICKRENNL